MTPQERENLPITSVAVELLAAQEPSLAVHLQDLQDPEDDSGSETERPPGRASSQPVSAVVQALLPSTICAAFPELIR